MRRRVPCYLSSSPTNTAVGPHHRPCSHCRCHLRPVAVVIVTIYRHRRGRQQRCTPSEFSAFLSAVQQVVRIIA
eukprot:scaffold107396_cov30-Phaeocystis_antarctica.AAC.1